MAETAVGAPPLPPGRTVHLPRRGTTFVRELPGPPGAPVALLLHGWTATADLNWFTAYETLGRSFRVLAMDLRGHGRGIRSRRPFRLEDCADDVAALADELGIERLIPVGYSMGGPVAQLTWRRHRDLVEGMVLCATARRFSGRGPAERAFYSGVLGLSLAARAVPSSLRQQLMDNVMRRRMEQGPLTAWAMLELRRNDPSAVIAAGAALGSFDSRAWLDQIDVPVAVIVTTEDHVVAPRSQLALAASIPHATVHHVRGDHVACVFAADRFVPALESACREVAGRT
jgi:pimeloyl-ACP methyl ester carboxylesterase